MNAIESCSKKKELVKIIAEKSAKLVDFLITFTDFPMCYSSDCTSVILKGRGGTNVGLPIIINILFLNFIFKTPRHFCIFVLSYSIFEVFLYFRKCEEISKVLENWLKTRQSLIKYRSRHSKHLKNCFKHEETIKIAENCTQRRIVFKQE